jgi:hypothetical protein
MTSLLDEHGQGGIADRADDEAYFSSFLLADRTGPGSRDKWSHLGGPSGVDRGGDLEPHLAR